MEKEHFGESEIPHSIAKSACRYLCDFSSIRWFKITLGDSWVLQFTSENGKNLLGMKLIFSIYRKVNICFQY